MIDSKPPPLFPAPERFGSSQPGQSGFALVSTILIIAVLTIMVVAFLQSMRIDQLTARSYLNKTKADLILEAGIAMGIERLRVLEDGPHAAVFTQDGNGSPYLFLFRQELNSTEDAFVSSFFPAFSTNLTTSFFPTLPSAMLSSGSLTVEDIDQRGDPITRNVSNLNDLQVDINRSISGERMGMVGLADAEGKRRSLPANWVYVKNDAGKVVGRFAFWIDDETSKIDLRTAGNTDGPGGTHLRGQGESLNQVAVHALRNLPDVVVGGLTLPGPGPQAMTDLNFQTMIENWRDLQGIFPRGGGKGVLSASFARYQVPPDGGTPSPPSAVLSEAFWEAIRPHVTVYSRSDDRGPNGKRKLNLNEVVTNTQDPVQIQKEVEAIREHIEMSLPKFSLRANGRQASEPDEASRLRYLTRLAANIRDMIDEDNVATVILEDGTAYGGSAPDPELGGAVPLTGLVGDDLPLAIGKERGPFLSEYTRLMKVISGHSSGTGSVQVRPVHYIEFHNITGQAISYADLGPNPFVRIANRAPWSVLGGSTFRPVDIIIRLPETFSIPANGYAVVTTDAPPFVGSHTGLLGGAGVYQVTRATAGPGTWSPVNAGGQTNPSAGDFEDYTLTLQVHSSNRYHMQTNIRPSGYGTNETRLVFGNDNGLIDVAFRVYEESNIYLGRNERNPTMHNTHIAGNTTSTDNNGGTSLRYTRGDPRTNTEITGLFADTRSVWIDGLGSYGDQMFSGGRMTQGSNNHSTNLLSNDVNQALPEWTSQESGNHSVLNSPITSLGQLGLVYDPARPQMEHRGGGRTLRIGQSDDPKNLRAGLGTSAAFQSWHGGYGSDTITDLQTLQNSHALLAIFRTDNLVGGRINPHALKRSDVSPAALAVVEGFKFNSVAVGGDSNSAGKELKKNGAGFPTVLAEIRNEITAGRPFAQVGDLSRLKIFNTRYINEQSEQIDLIEDVDSRVLADQAREEFLRRSFGLMETNSLSFTIHAVGQTGQFRPNGTFRVDATAQGSRTINFVPQYPEPYDEYVPTKPSGWVIETLRNLSY